MLVFNQAKANFVEDAWECAKAKVTLDYVLLSKGVKVVEVIGSKPQCIALVSASDIPLYVVSASLFSINALTPHLLPADSCTNSLKTSATYPLAFGLDQIFPNVLPAKFKDVANGQAQNELWNFLSNTLPFSPIIERAGCGCTFLEAGISVDNLKQILDLIASTGKKCESTLENIPGYSSSKKALNNLAEDLFSDQKPHMPVDVYYRNEFKGGQLSVYTWAHAIAKILNSSHDIKNSKPTNFLYGLYFAQNKIPITVSQKKQFCKTYFDEHKMSPANAEKVCNTMSDQFVEDVNALIPKFKNRHTFVIEAQTAFDAAVKYAEDECHFLYKKYGKDDPLLCLSEVRNLKGSIQYANPYDGSYTNSLGFPYSKEEIEGQLKGYQKYFYLEPLSKSGAIGAAYEAFENGVEYKKAISQSLGNYLATVNLFLHKQKLSFIKFKQMQDQDIINKFNAEVGNIWGPQCVQNFSSFCRARLKQAWELCPIMVAKYVGYSGSGDVWTIDPVKETSFINSKCKPSYSALVLKFKQYSEYLQEIDSKIVTCPVVNGKTVQSCLSDKMQLKLNCAGGMPSIKEEYFQSQNVSQSPKGSPRDCNNLIIKYNSKWSSNDELKNELLATYNVVDFTCKEIADGSCLASLPRQIKIGLSSLDASVKTNLWPARIGTSSVSVATELHKEVFTSEKNALLSLLNTSSRSNIVSLAHKSFGLKCPHDRTQQLNCLQEISSETKQCAVDSRRSNGGTPVGVDKFFDYCSVRLNKVINKYTRTRP